MIHQIQYREPALLYCQFSGHIDLETVRKFVLEIQPYLQEATESSPLHFMIDVSANWTWSLAARREFRLVLEREPRVGRIAMIRADRFTQIRTTFMIRVTNRHELTRFCESEEEAVQWISSYSGKILYASIPILAI